MAIRNSCKALIELDGKFLLNHYLHEDGVEYYDLPGGGQRPYETLEETVVRECREETGYEVEIVRLGAITEEICDDPNLRREFPDFTHKVHFVYLVRPVNPIRWEAASPDRHQVGCRWMTLEEMENYTLRVAKMPELIRSIQACEEIQHRPAVHKDTL